MNGRRVVILGAGPVGLAAGNEYLKRGLTVRYVTRTGRAPLAGAESLAADAADPQALIEAVRGSSIILHAAGAPYHRWTKDFPRLQTAVLAAAEATGAVAVFVENLYSYTADVMPLTPDSSENPGTKKGRLRLELSKQWLEAHASGRIKAVSVRAGDYWGPGATASVNSHFGARFFPAFEAGKPVAFLGDPDAPHSFAYLPDFARALADVSLDEASWGKAWIAPALGPATARQVAERFAATAGRDVRVQALPPLLLKVLGLFDPVVREVPEMLYQFDREFTVDSSAWTAHFGWKATALEQAVRDTWAARSTERA